MDISAAAGYFDTTEVLDAYSDSFLFFGQPDNYDLTKGDSARGFRRTISTTSLVLPTRGCISFGSEIFVVGRVIRDFFAGANHRSYLLLHPADGLTEYGDPVSFISGTPAAISAYAGESWLKDRKFETEGSDLRPEYMQFFHLSEGIGKSMVLKDAAGSYFRIQAVSRQPGGMQVVTAFDLGANALKTVSFVSSGAYDPLADAKGVLAPVSVPAFVEFFRANYHFVNNAAEKFERADMVATVAAADIAEPHPGDVISWDSVDYRVLERKGDGKGCWELHVRPEV